MISAQTPVYLLVPTESNERVLHPGKVLGLQANDVVLIGFYKAVAPAVGSDVTLFFDHNGKFFQQSGSILAEHDSAAQPEPPAALQGAPQGAPQDSSAPQPIVQAIVFRSVGSPVSAESRGSYRVSIVALQATARIDNERACTLVDISPEGLGVITSQSYRLGTAVKLLFDYEDQHLQGLARVQAVRQLPSGKYRCGLLVPSTDSTMRKSLQKITALVQRRQLQNLRRSA